MIRTCILIGHPVGHSVSPVIHRCAYRLLGIDATYELRDAPTESDVKELIDGIRSGAIHGANVTVPHKLLALRSADVLHPSAEKIGAANVLLRDEAGRIVAHNTDAVGLADELVVAKAELGSSLGDRSTALIVGSGGAALAAVVAAQMAGFSDVVVTARRYDPDVPQGTWPLASRLRTLGASLLPWPGRDQGGLPRLAPHLACIVQATSAGMKGTQGGEELAELLDLSRFDRLVAYDLVYNPEVTPFVRLARAQGHVARSGLGMLVGQAAHAIDAWFGRLPPKEPLLAAARDALSFGPS